MIIDIIEFDNMIIEFDNMIFEFDNMIFEFDNYYRIHWGLGYIILSIIFN